MITSRMTSVLQLSAVCFRTAPKLMADIRRQIWTNELKKQNEEKEKFLNLLPDIISSVSNNEILKSHPKIKQFIKQLIQYNSAGGKKTRGLMTVTAYQMLAKPENINEETLRLARVLGWCIELIQTSMLILDDIMDNSSTRRGAVCWYRLPGVGIRAINDSTMLIALVFENLKHNFSGNLYYSDLLDVFNETFLQISTGQHLDYISARNINLFTEKNYENIARFKTVYYTFKLPVFVSLLLANKSIESAYRNEEDLLTQMGVITLMQNDYMDCFTADHMAGKAGTDIQEGKCSWLAVQALRRCDATQRADFQASYGRADEASVRRVKRLYEQLELPRLYRDAEKAAFDNILNRIKNISDKNIVPPVLIRKHFHMVHQICEKAEDKIPSFFSY